MSTHKNKAKKKKNKKKKMSTLISLSTCTNLVWPIPHTITDLCRTTSTNAKTECSLTTVQRKPERPPTPLPPPPLPPFIVFPPPLLLTLGRSEADQNWPPLFLSRRSCNYPISGIRAISAAKTGAKAFDDDRCLPFGKQSADRREVRITDQLSRSPAGQHGSERV